MHTVRSKFSTQSWHITSPKPLTHPSWQPLRQQYPESPPHCASTVVAMKAVEMRAVRSVGRESLAILKVAICWRCGWILKVEDRFGTLGGLTLEEFGLI